MPAGVVSVIINIVYFIILRMDLYTDRAMMADGSMGEWHWSPIDRLGAADQGMLLDLQIIFGAVSIITGILTLCGIKKSIIKKIWLVSTVASTAVFITIMITAGKTHPHYG